MSSFVPQQPERPVSAAPSPAPNRKRSQPPRRRYLLIGLLVGACLVTVPLALAAATGMLDSLALRLGQLFPSRASRPAADMVLTLSPAWTATASPSPNAQAAPEATPTLSPSPDLSMGMLDYEAYAARQLMLDRDWAACVLAWDDILRRHPQYGEGYYYRSTCYLQMSFGQRMMDEFEAYLRQALEDIDQAIAIGDGVNGDHYYLRYRVYDLMATNRESAAARRSLSQLALDNLERALATGTGAPTAHRSLPASLVVAGHCAEGLSEGQRLLEAIEPGDSPSGSIHQAISRAYLCLGQYAEAHEYLQTALQIWDVPEWRYQDAVILYGLGRLEEARRILDDLILQDPYFSGYRYYLRALILYDQGSPDLAEQDLSVGAQNTWGDYHVAALVSGLCARDAGRIDEAVGEFTRAVASFGGLDRPFLERALRELHDLGVEAPTIEPVAEMATPLPTLAPPAPGDVLATPVAHQKVYEYGSGLIRLGSEGYYTVQFVPGTAIQVTEAILLTVTVGIEDEQTPTDLKIYLWQPYTNIWTMFNFEGGPIQVGNPGRFVLPDGSLFLAPYAAGDEGALLDVTVLLEVRLADGSLLTMGVP